MVRNSERKKKWGVFYRYFTYCTLWIGMLFTKMEIERKYIW